MNARRSVGKRMTWQARCAHEVPAGGCVASPGKGFNNSSTIWPMTWARTLAMSLAVALATGGVAHAQVAPFETVATLASDIVPVEREFDIPQSGAGQYRVKLTDIGAQFTAPAPAPLDSVKLVITRGKTVVVTIDGAANAGPVDTATFDATPGTYAVHVVGKPGTGTGSGPISVLVENVASNAAVLTLGGTLAAPETVSTDVRTYQAEIDVPVAGDYELTLTDLQFPRAIEQSGVFLFEAGASAITACLAIPEVVASNCLATRTVTLAAGKYTVVAAGALAEDHSSDAGVFSVRIRATSDGTVIHSRTVELGAVKRVSPASFVLNAGQHTLKLKDLKFPADLTSLSALVVGGGQASLATTLAPNVPFTVAADNSPYDVFAYSLPDAIEAAGSYEVDVARSGGTTPLAVVQAVGSASGSPLAYTYAADVATAGAYRAKLADFQFPVALSSTRLAVVQNGVVVGKTTASDPGPTLTLDLANLAAGPATAIAIVKPAAISGTRQSGAFGLELTPSGGTQLVLDVAQGVGPLISVRKVSVTQAGKYDITLADLGFPEVFHDLAAVVSRGAQRLGTLLVGNGGGNTQQGGTTTLPDFDASAANYSLTVIAQPSDTERAATYGLSFTQSPAGPTITLSSDSQTVTSGNTAKLTWSTTNATTCTASSTPAGVWSGTKATSGTETTVALTSATTFKLSCTGAGGRSSEQSVNVTIAAAGPSGGGGGGNFGWFGLLGLAAIRVFASMKRAKVA